MHVMVLGGAGYVGSALVPFLTAAGHVVESVDLEWFGNPGGHANLAYDITDPCVTWRIWRAEAVILLAGHSSVPMCATDRASSFRNNVTNFMSLLDLVRPDRMLLYASSAGVYGGLEGALGTEDTRLPEPTTYYDAQKREIDMYAELARREGRRLWGFRFGTVNGPAPHLRADVMLNQMVYTAMTQGEIRAANPGVQRPILGIRDLCRAFQTVLADGSGPGLYNLASVNAPVASLAAAAQSLIQRPIVWGPETPSYNMQMTSEKFAQRYRFVFEDLPEKIAWGLVDRLRRTPGGATTRPAPMPYGARA